MIYEYGNPEILKEVLDIKRKRETSIPTVVMAGNELATDYLIIVEGDGK